MVNRPYNVIVGGKSGSRGPFNLTVGLPASYSAVPPLLAGSGGNGKRKLLQVRAGGAQSGTR